ncbi:uncharacterized protein TNCV_3396851 [Trichonephila clavipes]|nr:uncharacterized protein TNCV_3396851 [Trichonephila clavipes]
MASLCHQSLPPTNLVRVDEVMVFPGRGISQWHSSGVSQGHLNFHNPELCLVQGIATDFAKLKETLTENFPEVRNKPELEVRFYSSNQNSGLAPSDFIYDLLKTHKHLGLNVSEAGLVKHIMARLEPQVQNYVEVRNPTTRALLLQVISNLKKDIRPGKLRVRVKIIRKDEIGNCFGGLPTIIEIEIGGVQKFWIDK